MKIGVRKRNFSKSFKAQTFGKYKRRAKRAFNPLYGKKGINLYKNPKKYFYDKAYRNLTVGMPYSGVAPNKKSAKKQKNNKVSEANKTYYYEEVVMKKDNNKQKFTENPIGWFKGLNTGWKILIVVLIIGLIGSIPYVLSGEYDKDREDEKQQVIKQEEDTKKPQLIDESFAEEYCQDAKFYGSILNYYSLIDVFEYNQFKYFGSSGGYDKDGNEIYLLRWNGKNKNTDDRATFVCYISGVDTEHVTLHYLGVDNIDIQGTHDFQEYTKDGQLAR